jgi:hypothetical protein
LPTPSGHSLVIQEVFTEYLLGARTGHLRRARQTLSLPLCSFHSGKRDRQKSDKHRDRRVERPYTGHMGPCHGQQSQHLYRRALCEEDKSGEVGWQGSGKHLPVRAWTLEGDPGHTEGPGGGAGEQG